MDSRNREVADTLRNYLHLCCAANIVLGTVAAIFRKTLDAPGANGRNFQPLETDQQRLPDAVEALIVQKGQEPEWFFGDAGGLRLPWIFSPGRSPAAHGRCEIGAKRKIAIKSSSWEDDSGIYLRCQWTNSVKGVGVFCKK